MICTVGQEPALHTLLSLYASVSDFLRPFRVEKLLALFYIDNNANGRKECYGTDFCVRARHEDLVPKESQSKQSYVCFDLMERTKNWTQFYQVWAWDADVTRLMQFKVKKGSMIWLAGSQRW